MALRVSPDGCKNVNFSLLTVSVEIFATKRLGAKLELFSLNTKKFPRRAVQGQTAQSGMDVELLETKFGGRRMDKCTSILAITTPPLLREMGTEQVLLSLHALTAVQTYVARECAGLSVFFNIPE